MADPSQSVPSSPRPPSAWRWVYTFLGAGLMRPGPGTWGSLLACVVLYVPLNTLGGSVASSTAVLLMAFAAFCIFTVIAAPAAIAETGRADPGSVVLDEGAGICVTLLLLPLSPGRPLVISMIAAFVAFRIFDILKPPPARQLERLPAGWGILLDDVAAGIYANLLCQLFTRFVLHLG